MDYSLVLQMEHFISEYKRVLILVVMDYSLVLSGGLTYVPLDQKS